MSFQQDPFEGHYSIFGPGTDEQRQAAADLAAKIEAAARAMNEAFARWSQRPEVRAWVRTFDTVYWLGIRLEYERHGRTRPDGRPRRSGHRHRGMRAWSRRHG